MDARDWEERARRAQEKAAGHAKWSRRLAIVSIAMAILSVASCAIRIR